MRRRPLNTDPFGKAPPAFVEYGYYLVVFYAIMSNALGISMAMLGAGVLALLAAYCVWRVGLRAGEFYKPSSSALACGAIFLAVQVFFHGESILDPHPRATVTWMLGLVVVQTLIYRKGFFHRLALVVFLIGLATMPFLQLYASGLRVERAGLDRSVGFANPNDLASWFGFCMVYCAVAGMEARTHWYRAVLWGVGIGCLFVIALTVSRGPLLAAAIATVIALRRLLKRGLVPAMFLVIVAWMVYAFGLFDQGVNRYKARLEESTGRLVVWPLVVERIWENPLVGVGVSKIETHVPYRSVPLTPHNGFLYIGLAGGALSLVLFTIYWMRVGRGALRARRLPGRSSAFLVPLATYALLINMQLSTSFMTPWMMTTLAAASVIGRGAERYRLRQVAPGKSGSRRSAWTKVGYLAPEAAPRMPPRRYPGVNPSRE